MKKTNRLFAGLMLGAIISLGLGFTSCSSDTVNERAQDGFIEIDLKWGDEKIEKFVFDLPTSGNDAIYAKKTACADNIKDNEYVLLAQNSYDESDMTFAEVHVKDGDKPEVKVHFRRHYGASVKFYNLYTITQDKHGLKKSNYHVPMSDDGIFDLNFATSIDDAVTVDMNNSETISQNYPLLRVRAVGRVKSIN